MERGLAGSAAAIVVLCAVGAPLGAARARLARISRVLQPLADRAGARVSRSATDGLAAWAASRHGPIGIDVQATPDAIDDALIEAALDQNERRFLAGHGNSPALFARLWAAKEAVLKAHGIGLAWSAKAVPVLPLRSGWQQVDMHLLGRARFAHLAPEHLPGIGLAVALRCPEQEASAAL